MHPEIYTAVSKGKCLYGVKVTLPQLVKLHAIWTVARSKVL